MAYAILAIFVTLMSITFANDYPDEPFDNQDRFEESRNQLQALLIRHQALNQLRRKLDEDLDDLHNKLEKRTCAIGAGLDRNCNVLEDMQSFKQKEFLNSERSPGRRRRRTTSRHPRI